MADPKKLHQVILEWAGRKAIEQTHLPPYILRNINPKFEVRPYQKLGLQYFLNYWEEAFDGKPRQNHQLLFHMATGSGKTLMMACLMMYLHEKGYRNFLFFVNSNNIINKTKDNFLNTHSSKYLFSDTISIGDKRIAIRQVNDFQSANDEDINVVFTTIQGLHMALNNPAENSITYEDFQDKKIVLISDEAHHINAETKKGNQQSQDELLETISWEGTVSNIFQANPNNVLLEFTATVDFNDPYLSEKYSPKLIYDYPLKDFRKDGYSKEVKVLQADLEPVERAIQAVILSQYRQKVFEKYGKAIKPVLMFKSKTINDSKKFFVEFIQAIQKLDSHTIDKIKEKSSDKSLQNAFKYFEENKITTDNLISEIKVDFVEEKLISVNSKEESEEKQIAVNSLEDNDYRAVFAVDKLNEGWDVLNLFDIVRLYNTRDADNNKVGKTTMSEAQLIGRGARYCPFQLTPEQPLFSRKFDADLENELRICEELYYHSAYNPKYIQELNVALEEIGIVAKETKQRPVRVKKQFKENPLYKAGHVFLNERIKYERKDIVGLDSSLIKIPFKHELLTGFSTTSIAFEKQNQKAIDKKAKEYPLSSFGTPIVRKALQRIEFFEFDNLKKYLPNLNSINEFISSENYLGKLAIEFTGSPEQVTSPSVYEKLDATTRLLEEVADVLMSDKVEFKGTYEFKPRMMKDVFVDKVLNFAIDENSDKEFGKSMNDHLETSYHLDLSTRAWFVFDDCFGTSEEKLLIQYIDKRYEDLSELYKEVYLIRNERHFKVYAFQDGRPLEPDFILYLIGREETNTMHYQVFIEPKGSHLLRADKWKEEFLSSIKSFSSVEQLFSNKKYVVWGLPFFNSNERMDDFSSSFNELVKKH